MLPHGFGEGESSCRAFEGACSSMHELQQKQLKQDQQDDAGHHAQDPATQRVPVCGSGVRNVSNRGKFDKGVGGSWQKCVDTRPW